MTRLRGTVKWFDTEKGWGFIRLEDGNEVFVHHSDIRGEGFRSLKDGAEVELEVERADRGPRARNVDPIGGEEREPGSGGSRRDDRSRARSGEEERRGGSAGGRGARGPRRDRKANRNPRSAAGTSSGSSRPVSGAGDGDSALRTLDEQVRERLSPRYRFEP
jgi:CspA family cold shock protein